MALCMLQEYSWTDLTQPQLHLLSLYLSRQCRFRKTGTYQVFLAYHILPQTSREAGNDSLYISCLQTLIPQGPAECSCCCDLQINGLQINGFQILRNKNISPEVFFSFSSVQFLSSGNIFILCVVQNKIFHPQTFCQLTSIFRRGVMLFIRMKLLCLVIKTKSLMKEPFAVFCIVSFTLL